MPTQVQDIDVLLTDTLSVVFLTLFVLVTVLRLYARIRLTESGFSLDDVFLCVASVRKLPGSVNSSESFEYSHTDSSKALGITFYANNLAPEFNWANTGKPIPASADGIMTFRYLAANTFNELIIHFIALSILTLYYRLSRPSTFFRHAVIFLPVLVIGLMIPLCIVTARICTPLRKLWHPKIPGQCGDPTITKLFKGYYIARTVVDSTIYILPIYHLWKLQMSQKKRIRLVGLFVLGGVSCLCGVAKMAVSFEAQKRKVVVNACKFISRVRKG